jgi:excinuclease ABC subunit A
VTCEVCGGRRYNRETLEVRYKGKSIADVLEMTVADALDFLGAIPSAQRKLQTLFDVGLGYIHLGQQATTLSGGEAQRVKLAKELSRRGTGRTVYVLDEPTTGLHFEDVAKLLDVLQKLVDQGNSVLVIEHNLDVIKAADWIIDMGPEGGSGGGYVVAQGTPEQVAAIPESHTGRYLAAVLAGMSTTVVPPAPRVSMPAPVAAPVVAPRVKPPKAPDLRGVPARASASKALAVEPEAPAPEAAGRKRSRKPAGASRGA